MKLYLGNCQDVVVDVDEIQVHPMGCSRGAATNCPSRQAWRSICWNGLVCTTKCFYYKASQKRTTRFTQQEAEQLARNHNAENSTNTYSTAINVRVSDITKMIMTRFRYIQPKVDYVAQPVPIDPYFVGLWLGDGTACNTSITNVDEKIVNYIREHAKSIGMIVTSPVSCDMVYFTIKEKLTSGRTNPLKDSLRAVDILNNKHIPEVYLENSVDIRLKVLAGLIDTDGYLHKNNYEIVQKSVRLSQDIVTLANSLGFFCRTVDKIGYATNTEKKTRRVYKRTTIFPGYHTPTIPVIIEYKKMHDNPVFNGITFSPVKTKTSHTHVWSKEMKEQFDETVAEYTYKGRVAWAKIVQNIDMYKHITAEALRHEHGDRHKAAAASAATKKAS